MRATLNCSNIHLTGMTTMPTRKVLREFLTELTTESYVCQIPLDKTNYGQAESNQIKLRVISGYHSLMYVDELLAKLNASETNISAETYRSYMRYIYNQSVYHTKECFNLMITINKHLGETKSIGRNQAIELLLRSTIECLNIK